MKQIKKLLPFIIIIILSITVWIFNVQYYFSFEIFKIHQQVFETYILNYLFLSILIYMSIYITVVALSIPGATFMTLAGGFLFGQWIGTIIVIISSTMGACCVFLTARMAASWV